MDASPAACSSSRSSTRPGSRDDHHVTNTNSDSSYDPATGLQRGAIDIEYRYINGSNFAEFSRVERLTADDTLSVIAAAHNTSHVRLRLRVREEPAHPGAGELQPTSPATCT
ncbi:MAG: hypothetical protein U1E76_27175 [Planctomycetota bacterium]